MFLVPFAAGAAVARGPSHHSVSKPRPSLRWRFLFGDPALEATVVDSAGGRAVAVGFSNRATGVVRAISVYVARGSRPRSLMAGLYSDRGGRPGSLLTTGTVSRPMPGAWNTLRVTPTSVRSGSLVWVAVLAKGGAVNLRSRRHGRCRGALSSGKILKSLPSSWSRGRRSSGCPLSAFVSGDAVSVGVPTSTGGGSGTGGAGGVASGGGNVSGGGVTAYAPSTSGGIPQVPVPVNVVAPTISGTAQQASTLQADPGTWTGSLSYMYQWLDCSGPTCSNISGASQRSYTLQRSDVGFAIDVVVTASNQAGSTSAASAQTGVVTSSSGVLYGSQGGPYAENSWPGGNWVPFASSSPWNRQLPPYSSATLDTSSAAEISWMSANWAGNFTPWTFSNNPNKDESSSWDHPIYWAKSTDPTYTIKDVKYACSSSTASSCPSTVQIPNGAEHALGSDGHLAVIQPDGHTEVDMWQVQNPNPLVGGGVVTVNEYGALDLNSSGCCGGSTAANQGLTGGQIRGPELAAGTINHALTASEECSNGSYVPPATGTAAGGCPGAPPDGARLQLKMTDAQISALNVPAYQKTILTAMAHYGVFITDTGGSPMDLEFEPAIQYTAFNNTSNTIMSYLETQGYSDPTTVTISLPWTDFQIVSSCYATNTC